MKKSIGIIIPSLTKYGGAERYMIELCRYIQNDFDITIYAPDINTSFLEEHGINENVKKINQPKLHSSSSQTRTGGPNDIVGLVWMFFENILGQGPLFRVRGPFHRLRLERT